MRKNFLNAILFGGLIALSAGSFVACSDYDDDINGLQKQIDSVNTTLAALQTQVNAGRWVTTLTQIDGGFTVVFSDGSTYDIVNGQDGATGATGADGAAGSVVTIGTDGYWYIDGVKTTYKAEIDFDKMSYVQDGYWYVGGEKTDYKAVGNTYAVQDTDGVWTLHVPGDDGTMKEVKLPTAASKITSIAVVESDNHDDYLDIYATRFTSTVTDWDGSKELPASGSYIIASKNKVLLQVTPADVALASDKFTYVDSEGNTLGISLKAEPYTGLLTRADAAANGLYELSATAQTVSEAVYKTIAGALKDNSGDNVMFGLAYDGVLRSSYDYATVKGGYVDDETQDNDNNSLSTLETVSYGTGGLAIKSFSKGADDVEFGAEEGKNSIGTIKIGEANTIKFTLDYIYDAYLTFNEEDVTAFGIVYDKETAPLTFTVGKYSEKGGLTIPFTLTTIDVLGTVKTTALEATIAIEDADVKIEDKEVGVIDLESDNRYIDLDLAKFKINTDAWKYNCAKVEFGGLYSDAACEKAIDGNGNIYLTPHFYAGGEKTETAKDATLLSIFVGWNTTPQLEANKQYYAKLVSKSSDDAEIGTIVLPVKFTVSSTGASGAAKKLLEESFKEGTYTVKDGVFTINAYSAALGNYINNLTVNSDNTASIGTTKVAFAFDDTEIVAKDADDKDVTSADVAEITIKDKKVNVALKKDESCQVKPADESSPVVTGKDYIYAGYGKELIVKVTTQEASSVEGFTIGDEYSFKVRIESPIAAGEVKLDESVKLKWSDLKAGTAKITSSQLKGYRADKTDPYDVFMKHKTLSGSNYVEIRTNEYASNVSSLSYKGSKYLVLYGDGTTGYKMAAVTGVYNILYNNVNAEGYLQFKSDATITGDTTDTITVTISDSYGYTSNFKVNVPIGD